MYGGGAVDSGGGGNTARLACFRSTVKECGTMKGRAPPPLGCILGEIPRHPTPYFTSIPDGEWDGASCHHGSPMASGRTCDPVFDDDWLSGVGTSAWFEIVDGSDVKVKPGV